MSSSHILICFYLQQRCSLLIAIRLILFSVSIDYYVLVTIHKMSNGFYSVQNEFNEFKVRENIVYPFFFVFFSTLN